jgi:hypothetical protein
VKYPWRPWWLKLIYPLGHWVVGQDVARRDRCREETRYLDDE